MEMNQVSHLWVDLVFEYSNHVGIVRLIQQSAGSNLTVNVNLSLTFCQIKNSVRNKLVKTCSGHFLALLK